MTFRIVSNMFSLFFPLKFWPVYIPVTLNKYVNN